MTTLEQILLRLGIDNSQVGPGLNDFKGKVNEAMGSAHKSFLHAGSAGRAFHKLIDQVSNSSPILGAALKLALNPVVGVLALATMAFEHFKKKIEELNALLDQMEAISSHKMGDMREAVSKAADQFERLRREYQHWLASHASGGDKITTQLEAQLERLKEHGKVQEGLLTQKRKLAETAVDQRASTGLITGGQAAEEKTKLEIADARDRRALGLAQAQAELQAQRAAAESLQSRMSAEGTRVDMAHSDSQDWTRLKEIEKLKSNIPAMEEDIAKREAAIKQAEKIDRKEQAAEMEQEQAKTKELLERQREKLQGLESAQANAIETLKESEQQYDRTKAQFDTVGKAAAQAAIKLNELRKMPLDVKNRGEFSVSESSRATVHELAQKSGYWEQIGMFRLWRDNPYGEKAKEIERLESESRDANIRGDFKTRNEDDLRARQLRGELGKTGVLKSSEYMESINENIANLVKLAEGEGLKVRPENGE